MNFLAHLYLSGDNPEVKVGNFIGDFVKGRDLFGRFEYTVAKGIELHRAIDDFTDKHVVVMQSKERIRPKYRHYSSVIIDMYYDHLLAKNWDTYYPVPLANFAEEAYTILEAHYAILPDKVKQMLPYMINGNWLLNYSELEGIHRALTGMSRRTSFSSGMEEAIVELEKYYHDFEQEFMLFFPDIKMFSDNFLQNI